MLEQLHSALFAFCSTKLAVQLAMVCTACSVVSVLPVCLLLIPRKYGLPVNTCQHLSIGILHDLSVYAILQGHHFGKVGGWGHTGRGGRRNDARKALQLKHECVLSYSMGRCVEWRCLGDKLIVIPYTHNSPHNCAGMVR